MKSQSHEFGPQWEREGNGKPGWSDRDIRQFKHQTLTQTQTVITREFSQLNVAKPHLRNIQMLAWAV